MEIFKENEEDYEKFCEIKDKILIQNDYSLLRLRCFHCRSLKHTIKNCHLLHYIPDIEKIVKRHEFFIEEPRRKFNRKKHLKFQLPLISKLAKLFEANEENFANLTSPKYYGEQTSKTDTLKFFDIDDDDPPPIELSNIDNKDKEKESIKEIENKDKVKVINNVLDFLY